MNVPLTLRSSQPEFKMTDKGVRKETVLKLCQEAAKKALKRYAKMSTGNLKTLRDAPKESVLQVLISSELASPRLWVECEVSARAALATNGLELPDFPDKKNPVFDIVGYTPKERRAKYFIEVKAAADLAKLEKEYEAKLRPARKALAKAKNGRVVVQVAVTKVSDTQDGCLSLFRKERGAHAALHGLEAVKFVHPESNDAVWIGVGVYEIKK